MTDRRTPQLIAAHISRTLVPAIEGAFGSLGARRGDVVSRALGCAITLEYIDLAAIAVSLGHERAQARQGRPRQGESRRSGGIGTSTTEDVANEVVRLQLIGLDLAEALDRLHPDPRWPPLTSGWRQRTTTATEHVTAACVAVYGAQDPIRAAEDLSDAVDGLHAATRDVVVKARRADQARAWGAQGADVDPPNDLIEAARCSGWPKGRDREGALVGCRNWRGAQGHLNPETNTHHHEDLCDDCYRSLCPLCWSRVRRSPGAKECMACEIRLRRGRAA